MHMIMCRTPLLIHVLWYVFLQNNFYVVVHVIVIQIPRLA